MVVASDLRLMIYKRFSEAGIGVPFPQRDMHLTTGKPLRVEISNSPAPKPDPYA
jgi:small-conductance mechanosensitive channel